MASSSSKRPSHNEEMGLCLPNGVALQGRGHDDIFLESVGASRKGKFITQLSAIAYQRVMTFC